MRVAFLCGQHKEVAEKPNGKTNTRSQAGREVNSCTCTCTCTCAANKRTKLTSLAGASSMDGAISPTSSGENPVCS